MRIDLLAQLGRQAGEGGRGLVLQLRVLQAWTRSCESLLLNLSLPSWEMGLLTVSTHGPHAGHQAGCASPLRALRVE